MLSWGVTSLGRYRQGCVSEKSLEESRERERDVGYNMPCHARCVEINDKGGDC